MKFKFILIGAFISLISINSFSKAEWVNISSNELSETYIDVNSIQEFKQYYPATTHKAWFKVKKKYKTQTSLLNADELISLTYFDCQNRVMGSKSLKLYRNNKVIDQHLSPQVTMEDPVPDSILYEILEYVCS